MLKKEYQNIGNILLLASKDDGKNLETLKQALTENGFKHWGMGVSMMIDEMVDRGMDVEQAAYWKALGMMNLPYHPAAKLIKEE